MRIEAIFRQSTMSDIKKYWELSGRHFNADEDGQMVFDNVEDYYFRGDVIVIVVGKAEFIYNVSDFYRWKIIREV